LGNYLASRVTKIALPVELTDVPRFLIAYPVDCTYEVTVGRRVGRLLQLPKVVRQTGDSGGRIKHDFRSIET